MNNKDISPFINDEYDLMNSVLFNNLNSKSTCNLGYIISVNETPVSVDIQPAVNYYDKVNGFQKAEVLKNIPLAQLANNTSSIRMPLNPGDVGVILWFDREVFSWLDNNLVGPKDPESGTLHNESACIFIPLITKLSQAPSVKNNGVDFFSVDVSLMTQLISALSNISTTLSDISILLTTLSTFNTALIALTGSSDVTTYSTAVASAATTSNVALTSINSSISTVITAMASITNQLTIFKGVQ